MQLKSLKTKQSNLFLHFLTTENYFLPVNIIPMFIYQTLFEL